jgi:hypothetical protein
MEKCEAKKLLEIDDDVSVILSVGRLSIGDKMDYLSVFEKIRKFKKIYTTKEKFLFVFAGGDIYGQKSLMEEVINGSGLKEHVRFVGNFDETEKHVLYSASDVFISLSDNFQETFGVNILEAMYYKLPCIVSDWNGYRDLVTNNENGFLVRTSWADCAEDINNAATIQGFYQNHLLLSKSVIVDTDEFIDKLRMLLENHGLRFQFGQNGYKKVVEKFDWKKNIENYVKLFNKYRISANCLKQTQNNALLSPDFFRCFKHYAGNIISGNEYVSFTRAAKTEEESITLQILASAAPEVYTRLYLSLYQEFAYKRKVLIDELTEWLKKSKKISGNEALRVILLFLKYNLLAFTRD